MTMSFQDKGSRELAAAWLRRGNAPVPRTRPTHPDRRVEGSAVRAGAKPDTGAVFHSDTHVSFSRA